MGDNTGIEWTDATWNPVAGCSVASPGCDNCYAAKQSAGRLKNVPAYKGLALRNPETGVDQFTGEVRLLPERLDQPLRWKRPRRIFVNSMSDLFHPDAPDAFIEDVFGVMARAQQHSFQVLTKRPHRMAAWMNYGLRAAFSHWAPYQDGVPGVRPMKAEEWPGWPLPNVWLGTSVENQRYADLRIPYLLSTPAAVRFLSVEPMLGPVDLAPWLTLPRCPFCRGKGILPGKNFVAQGSVDPNCFHCNGTGKGIGTIDWVIVGGESGPHARPMHPGWVRTIRDQCVEAGVPFLFKQWGEYGPAGLWPGPDAHITIDGQFFQPGERLGMNHMMQPAAMHRWGKKAAGRELDRRTWDEYPG